MEEFKTKDMVFSAVLLTFGFPILDVEKHDRAVYFVFPIESGGYFADAILQGFGLETIRIEPQAFYKNVKKIKTIIYANNVELSANRTTQARTEVPQRA